MLTNFADNYFLNDYINHVYNKYLLQSPSVLFNYYCITNLSKYSKNYSAYKQYSSNTIYDCLMLTEGFNSTTVTQRTQSGEAVVPFYSLDQIEISIPTHIFSPLVGDKLSFSTDIQTLLSRSNSRIFEVVQIEYPTPFTQTRNFCKVTCSLSVNANEETLKKYTNMNYVYLPFSNKYCKLESYIHILNIIECYKNIIQEVNKRFENSYMILGTSCVIDVNYIINYFLAKINCNVDTLTGINRIINSNPIFYKPLTNIDLSKQLKLEEKEIDYNLIRKYPYITKFSKVIKPAFDNVSNLSEYVSLETLQTFSLISQINNYDDRNNDIANMVLSAMKSVNFQLTNSIEIIMYLAILIKLENILLYDYSR